MAKTAKLRQVLRPYGIKARLTRSVLFAAVTSALVFVILYHANDFIVSSYFNNSSVYSRLMERKVSELQNFIDEEHISSDNLSPIEKWEDKQALVLLELYDGNDLVYSSYYQFYGVIDEYMSGEELPDKDGLYDLRFADKNLSAMVHIDVSYGGYVMGTGLALVTAIIVFVVLFAAGNRKLIRYIIRLGDEVQIIEGGGLDYEISIEGDDELTDLARSLNRMREVFKSQIITEQQLRQASSKLISEMSHDLRTPLTGLMLYTEIVKSGKYKDETELKEYIDKIEAKAALMKQMSDGIFEYAIENRSAGGASVMRLEQVLPSFVGAISDELRSSGFTVQIDADWRPIKVRINEDVTGRISENIVSNIIKYADKSATIYIETVYDKGYCGVSFINSAKRNIEVPSGHGIGLESVESLMNSIGGKLFIEQTDDAFEVVLFFSTE